MNLYFITGIILGCIGILMIIVALTYFKDSINQECVFIIAIILFAICAVYLYLGFKEKDKDAYIDYVYEKMNSIIAETESKTLNSKETDNQVETMERHGDEYTEIHYYEDHTEIYHYKIAE